VKTGTLLFTFHKDMFYDEYGPHAIDLIKKHWSYKGETPKTITFELSEDNTRQSAKRFLFGVLNRLMEEFKEKLRIKHERETKYLGKTIIDV
jgi:hypothetical protein